MNVPPEIAFRHVEPTDALRRVIREGIDSLDETHPRLTRCRVVVEETSRGAPRVHLEVSVPADEIVAEREAVTGPDARDLPAALRAAFDVARRQLRERRKRAVGE